MPADDLIQILEERGFIHQCTNTQGLREAAARSRLTIYTGYDATAKSLHVGNLLGIMMMRWAQTCGHRPIVLLGGGTTKVGDPSGKDESRKLLDDGVIAENVASIRSCFDPFITFGDGPSDALVVNNADWLDELAYIPFLRDIGPHFTINRMLTMESVKQRLDREQPLTFLEFNYMILQAYDFAELNKRFGCTVQFGGSDQWGNIVNGIDLARRTLNAELFGLTTPLMTTASGQKMGKSATGAIWLRREMLSPYDYFQFWRNTEDADVQKFLALYTDLPMDEVRRLGALEGQEINEAKKVLAFEATKLLHGEAEATQAQRTAEQTFEQGQTAEGLPTVEIARADFESGQPLWGLLVKAELCASNGEGRRLIKGGGAKVNDSKISDPEHVVTAADIKDGVVKLSAGKKRHALLQVI